MNHQEFLQAINDKARTPVHDVWDGYNAMVVKVSTIRVIWGLADGVEITVPRVTKGFRTSANVDAIVATITPEVKVQADANDEAFKQTAFYAERLRVEKAKALAARAGYQSDEHGTYARGDHFFVKVLDVEDTEEARQQHLFAGEMLTLIEVTRKRVYANSYGYGPGYRYDYYLVGENENGVPFAHVVKNGVRTVGEAIDWIWQGNELVARHGDVAVCIAKRQPKAGQMVEGMQVVDSHYISGEVYQNGALYARNAVLAHQKGQHPDVQIGPEWRKIVVGRRSTKSASTVD